VYFQPIENEKWDLGVFVSIMILWMYLRWWRRRDPFHLTWR